MAYPSKVRLKKNQCLFRRLRRTDLFVLLPVEPLTIIDVTVTNAMATPAFLHIAGRFIAVESATDNG